MVDMVMNKSFAVDGIVVGLATAGLDMVGLATVGLATAGLNMVGLATVGLATVDGIAVGFWVTKWSRVVK